MTEPLLYQTVKLPANPEEGWPEEIGVYLGTGQVQLLNEYRDGSDDDGLRDVDLTVDGSWVEVNPQVTVTMSRTQAKIVRMLISEELGDAEDVDENRPMHVELAPVLKKLQDALAIHG